MNENKKGQVKEWKKAIIKTNEPTKDRRHKWLNKKSKQRKQQMNKKQNKQKRKKQAKI